VRQALLERINPTVIAAAGKNATGGAIDARNVRTDGSLGLIIKAT
jgi:hypothetical protein